MVPLVNYPPYQPPIPPSQPPLQPRPPELQPATRGDIGYVVAELQAIRRVLEQICALMQDTRGPADASNA
jgi:hypothetical protein